MVIKIIVIVLIIILFAYIHNKYSPKIDIILSNGTYVIIMWYNSRDNNGNCIRTYKKLFTL